MSQFKGFKREIKEAINILNSFNPTIVTRIKTKIK